MTEVKQPVIFKNQKVVVFNDLSFKSAPATEEWKDSQPVNAKRISRAKLARELGLNVQIPEPQFAVPKGQAVATQEEVETALKTIRFVDSRDHGPKIDTWIEHHPHGCQCGCCPSDPVFSSTEREVGAGWDIECPAEWFENPRRMRIKVMLPDGSKFFSMNLIHQSSCTRMDPHDAERYGVPQWIREEAERMERKCQARRTVTAQAADDKLKAELMEEFGLN